MKKISPLYGALAGDITGSAFEWNNYKGKDFKLFSAESHFTDDSVMTVATADAVLHGLDYKTVYQKWGNRYPLAGYGGLFSQWITEDNPQPYNSWGNGSAMRVSPVGWFGKNISEVLDEARKSAEVTHNHPEGVKGAQAAALAVFMARNGETKGRIKLEMDLRFGYNLNQFTLDKIRPNYSFDVSCQGTLPVALLAFLESTGFEDAIRNAVSVGGDSDTIAAITGAIALAFYKEMPEYIIREVEQRLPEDMRKICDEFTQKGEPQLTVREQPFSMDDVPLENSDFEAFYQEIENRHEYEKCLAGKYHMLKIVAEAKKDLQGNPDMLNAADDFYRKINASPIEGHTIQEWIMFHHHAEFFVLYCREKEFEKAKSETYHKLLKIEAGK